MDMARLRNIKIPTWVVVLAWIYCIWRFFKAGYLQKAFVAAKDYVRKLKI